MFYSIHNNSAVMAFTTRGSNYIAMVEITEIFPSYLNRKYNAWKSKYMPWKNINTISNSRPNFRWIIFLKATTECHLLWAYSPIKLTMILSHAPMNRNSIQLAMLFGTRKCAIYWPTYIQHCRIRECGNESWQQAWYKVDISDFPDYKVHGANMGPIWGRQDPGGPHVGPMNFAIWFAYLITTSPLEYDCHLGSYQWLSQDSGNSSALALELH